MKRLYDSLRGVRERGCQAPGERRLHRAKLLPKIHTLGFLNPDIEYFK